jgi:alpha-glucosidase
MQDGDIPADRVQDPWEKNVPGLGLGRDPERTPMQWDAGPNAGFTAQGVTPWLPVADDFASRNVAAQDDAPTSMLNYFRALAHLRRDEPALNVGDYASVDAGSDDVFAYTRTAPNTDRFLVALNFSAAPQTINLSSVAATAAIALATDMQRSGSVNLSALALAPNEGLVLRF